MKQKAIALSLALALLCACALPASARNDQLVPDSSTRRMTESECWNWTYEALGFVFHEILARHGFIFDPNGSYGWYFTSQSWYHAVASRNNQDVYNSLNATEWYNINLAKRVRSDMKQMGTTNPSGRPAPKKTGGGSTGYSEPRLSSSVFREIRVNGGLRLPVYSAPSTASWRGADGKALCASLNGSHSGVYAAGREGGWVLIAYYLNHGANQGGWRVGYVQYSKLTGLMDTIPDLQFYYRPAQITSSCRLTDDPLGIESPITRLTAGTGVTLLMWYENEYAYIETTYYGETVRGFVPIDCVTETGGY